MQLKKLHYTQLNNRCMFIKHQFDQIKQFENMKFIFSIIIWKKVCFTELWKHFGNLWVRGKVTWGVGEKLILQEERIRVLFPVRNRRIKIFVTSISCSTRQPFKLRRLDHSIIQLQRYSQYRKFRKLEKS